MNGLRAALALLALALAGYAGTARAQTVPDWQDDAILSIARIQTQRCIGFCASPDEDRFVRRGTSFVVALPSFEQPVLVTALHLVAGANSITYQFTEAGEEPVRAGVIAIDKTNDLAILPLAPEDQYSRRPLTLEAALPADNQVIIYGYKMGDGQLESDQGLVKFKAPQTLGNAPIGDDAREGINRLGYPSLDMIIVGLEQALDPGDSGAPVFNSAGQVIGIGQGGLQGSQLSWMVPARTLAELKLRPGDGTDLEIFGIRAFFSARDAFYERVERTGFGTEPMVRFSFEWRTSLPILREWESQMEAAFSGNSMLLGSVYNAPHGTQRVEPGDPYFPARDDPFRQAIAGTSLSLICYRAEVFEGLLNGTVPGLPQSDLSLDLPLGRFADSATDDGLGLGYNRWAAASDEVVLFSNTPIRHRSGIGSFHLHPDVEFIEDLYGGACRIALEAIDPDQEGAVKQLNDALRMRGGCVHLFLSPNTHTPVSFTGYLPLGDDLAEGALWGILPDVEPRGTADDLACM